MDRVHVGPIFGTSEETFLLAVAKVTLFACPLHINATRKVVSLHLMRQLGFPPEHPMPSFFSLLCEAHPYYQYLDRKSVV